VFRNHQQPGRLLAAAIAIVALAHPAGSSAYRDGGYQDLRNPDSRTPAVQTERAKPQPAPPSPPPSSTKEAAFDWGDAAIGAASVLGLLLIGLAVALTFQARHSMVRSKQLRK
jgi:hypothetical protein